MKKLSYLLIICFSTVGFTQEYEYPQQTVGYLALFSTNNYEKAVSFGQKAADQLKVDFKHTYLYDEMDGLLDTTICGCGETHGYMERGRYDEGDYISIELSDRYELPGEFGRYIVIACSYPISYELFTEIRQKILQVFPDAHYFEAEVYTGCMH